MYINVYTVRIDLRFNYDWYLYIIINEMGRCWVETGIANMSYVSVVSVKWLSVAKMTHFF